MKSAVALLVILLAFWLLNSGHYTVLVTSFGIISCALVLWLARRMLIVDTEAVPIHFLPRVLAYGPWLIKEIFLSNLDVARRILTPGTRALSPRVFEAPTTQSSDLGRVFYANSITLTPGTVSIRVRSGSILVHGIADEVAEGLLEGEMDRKVTWMEGRQS